MHLLILLKETREFVTISQDLEDKVSRIFQKPDMTWGTRGRRTHLQEKQHCSNCGSMIYPTQATTAFALILYFTSS